MPVDLATLIEYAINKIKEIKENIYIFNFMQTYSYSGLALLKELKVAKNP